MQDDQTNVWISREEYQRLQVAAQNPQPYGHQPYVGTQVQPAQPFSSPQPLPTVMTNEVPQKNGAIKTTLGIVLAVALYASLTIPMLRIIAAPVIGIFAIFSILSFTDFLHQRRPVVRGLPIPKDQLPPRAKRSTYKTLLLILGIVLLMPVIFYGGLIIVLLVVLSTSGSSS